MYYYSNVSLLNDDKKKKFIKQYNTKIQVVNGVFMIISI